MKVFWFGLFILFGHKWQVFAQNVDYSAGSSKVIKFGNDQEGMYSSSYLSPVGQGGAGADPKDVKTEFGFGIYFDNSKTAYDLGQEKLNSDQADLDLKYQDNIFKLFQNDYFPDKQWNGTPLVEKVYAILEGIRGNPEVAKQNAQKYRKYKLTNIKDLELWGNITDQNDLRSKYIEEYKKENGGIYPAERDIEEFINVFFAIRNSITWAGLCHQFSAANADPFILEGMKATYDRSGEVFLCQKPITLGEVKEATTMLYDKIEYDQMKGGKISFKPNSDPSKNYLNPYTLDFYPKLVQENLTGNTVQINNDKTQQYFSDYSTYVYQNYYERYGKNPTGLDFCELDKALSENERRDYSSQTDRFSKNKVPIMNLSGNGEVWNNPITSASRKVKKYNIYTGQPIQDESQTQSSNSFSELIQLFVDKKLRNESGVAFDRARNLLLRNYTLMCTYAFKNNMEGAKRSCENITGNQPYSVPAPTSYNAKDWSKFPKELALKNTIVDNSLFELAKSFISMESSTVAYRDNRGLPRIRSTDTSYFSKFKFQNIDLNLQYVDQTSFADDKKNPTQSEMNYSGVVLVDESQSPAELKGCSWNNVWAYNSNLKKYESRIPASFMTLDVPSCPNDTDAVGLLDKVNQCLTFKELVSKYNEWMLDASTGMNDEKVLADINHFKEKFPETNIDWDKLKRQIIQDFDNRFIEESEE